MFAKQFKQYIRETKPNFKQFSGLDRCLFLTGGRAIKFSTKQFRAAATKLPSTDYDFKWVLSRRPSTKDLDQIQKFFTKLVEGFVVHMGGAITIESRTKRFDKPVLQNPLLKRYTYAFFDFGLKYRGKVHDLIDVVVMRMKGANYTILDKDTSERYGIPIPKVSYLYFETAMVVSKTLITNDKRNGWRNPIRSTHPTEPNKYRAKGLRNVNRLSVMRNVLKNDTVIGHNIRALKVITKNRKMNVNTRLHVGRLIGAHMNSKIKNLRVS